MQFLEAALVFLEINSIAIDASDDELVAFVVREYRLRVWRLFHLTENTSNICISGKNTDGFLRKLGNQRINKFAKASYTK
jgi:hypothetical protein